MLHVVLQLLCKEELQVLCVAPTVSQGTTDINARGISSLSATSPLYVIGGVYGDINMVDPADIQSIEVLKRRFGCCYLWFSCC